MDPPTCVQNAMMTKDKKPFTYTPGGIDLSEVRSPRMARRIERNANLGGVGDVSRPAAPSQPQDYSNLPPSTLAAMRPQPQVQVFPSGPPPPAPMKGRGGPVPPPPPMNIPPPPPPPTCPLPTQKVKTFDNQVLERPDMTKIIPDEPMKLLRKTGGPQPRKSVVDQMFEEAQRGIAPKSPPAAVQHGSPQFEQPQQRYQQGPPSPPQHQYQPPQQQYQPPSPPQHQYQPPSPPHYQQPRQPQPSPQPQQYQPPSPPQYQQQRQPPQSPPQQISPAPPQKQPQPLRFQKPEIPLIERQSPAQAEPKTSTAHIGPLHVAPANQKKVVSPPTPPERNLDSPNMQTPPLREAPRPWQTKKMQEDLPPWAKRDNGESQQTPSPQAQQTQQSPQQPAQQRWPASRPAQEPQPQYSQPKQMHTSQPYNQQQFNQQPFNNQQPVGVRIEIRTRPGMQCQDDQEERKTNAVYVTQPVILQHPGGRVIPVKVEGSNGARTPNTPGERSLNRQQSWGANNPTQSHAFKIIQKITNTDGDDDDEDAPVTEHPPRYTQQFQQPADQMRRMKINDGNHIASKFNQVPQGGQSQNSRGPVVRTIPIKIEDDDSPTPYVHPSQQAPVPEPKKYTGSAIPSRSFKILQAMTAPENASVDDQNEDASYEQWGYDPYYYPYPPSPLPYWQDYFHACCHHDPPSGFSRSQRRTLTPGRQTPSTEKSTPTPSTGRNTPTPGRQTPITGRQTPTPRLHPPLPLWGYVPPPPYAYPHSLSPYEESGEENTQMSSHDLSLYGYYDAYRHYQYYGVPPMYHPPPQYQYPFGKSHAEDVFEQSSTHENNTEQSTSKPKLTPTLCVKEQVINNADFETEDSDTESEDDRKQFGTLRSIKSVQNINVYYEKQDSNDDEEDTDVSEKEYYVEECSETTDDDVEDSIVEDEGPHQLSVIYEESERTDSRLRTVSVLSDSNTIADIKSDDEDVSKKAASPRLPLKITVQVSEEEEDSKTILVEDGIVTSFGNEIHASFTVKAPTRYEVHNRNDEDQDMKNPTEEDGTTNEVSSTKDEGKQSDESEDWWGILGTEEDIPPRRSIICSSSTEIVQAEEEMQTGACVKDSNEITENSENSSETCSRDVNEDLIGTGETTLRIVLRRQCKEETKRSEIEDICIETAVESKRRSIYQEFEDDEEQIETESPGKLIEMESFVEKLERMQKESGLWKTFSKKEDVVRNVNDVPEEMESDINAIEANNEGEKEINECQGSSEEEGFDQDHMKNDLEPQNTPAVELEKDNVNCQDTVESESEEVDFWSTIKKDEDDFGSRFRLTERCSAGYREYSSSMSTVVNDEEIQNKLNIQTYGEEIINQEETSSQDIRDDVKMNLSQDMGVEEDNDEKTNSMNANDGSDESSDNEEVFSKNKDENSPMTIKERIEALRDSIKQRQTKATEEEIKDSVKDKLSVLEVNNQYCSNNRTLSTKSSVKSFEEYSEEEDLDSGVTSDMSRHISDTEEFPELKKLTKYQRAATHSRLFKLLQDECDNETSEEVVVVDKFSKLSVRNRETTEEGSRRDQLTLPLSKSPNSSHPSSGICSPTSVNDKLVNELVQSLLKHKKGQMFKNLPKDKLYAAATKILQEEMDIDNIDDADSFMSPLKSSTGYSTAVQTPQEFGSNYDEYKQYYESWNNVRESCGYDIIPSKAFKLLQEHANANRTGTIAGLLAKCPRVLSSKNIHKLMKLLENPEASPPNLESPLDSNEVTSAS
ncbi:unnamed protein product [Acanthoscelides obtectus]|uniref:Uncharacterized protein n=1 Tax=Acanthoscelides obtectus TaxID=200917 RepID=A0A9P0LIR6_ACAOB|nr:unnamed protein product [Acanthoscelides obtectus]CAK1663910.1 hypothetical protein AOBTE_LOCUS23926 [Acanthoscelides obtectus]